MTQCRSRGEISRARQWLCALERPFDLVQDRPANRVTGASTRDKMRAPVRPPNTALELFASFGCAQDRSLALPTSPLDHSDTCEIRANAESENAPLIFLEP
jgi:hypothetical protein